MKNLRYYNEHMTPCSISDLDIYLKKGAKIQELHDVVEDSGTAQELIRGINKILPYAGFKMDRETDKYVRLKQMDPFGNIYYLRAEF